MSRVSAPTTRFTVPEFERMVEANLFGTTRVELVNGRVHFMTQRRPHMVAMSKSSEALQGVRRPTDWVIVQGTLRLDRYNAPDPDLLWLPIPIDTPEEAWPAPVLLVEISDTTYRYDSGVKLRKYARAGVPDYWIENLKQGRIEVYRDPFHGATKHDAHYKSVSHFTRGQMISPLARPEIVLQISDLLP